MTTQWFETDKNGLNKQAKERGSAFILIELLSNALDERFSGVTEVSVSVEPVPNKSLCKVVVEDNSPRGYGDYLHHAYTLFAESYKRNNPLQSGQFNFGCKLWLSLCKTAKISTTSGVIEFNEYGRNFSKKKRDQGTRVEGLMEMSRSEYAELETLIQQIIIPEDIKVTFNGQVLVPRKPIKSFEAQLPTKIVDDEGVMKPTTRTTNVSIYEVKKNEIPTIYELGIPVVETDIRWHVKIDQKVPLNKDRDNVTPAFHRKLRTVVAENTINLINEQDVNSWCNDVLEDSHSSKEVREKIVKKKFGTNAAVFDPKDTESNIRWQTQHDGTIVHGRNLTKQQWENVKEFEILKPAGKLAPTPKPWSDDPEATPSDFYEENEWTEGMKEIAEYAQSLAKELNISFLRVAFAKKMNDRNVSACYAKYATGGLLEFNMQNLGFGWFDNGISVEVDMLIIHELAHHFVNSHHTKEHCQEVPTGMFYDACCYVGAKAKQWQKNQY